MSHATGVYTCGYLEDYGPPVPGDVDTVGLPVGHVPVVRVDAEGFSGAPEAVADLQASCVSKGERLGDLLAPRFG